MPFMAKNNHIEAQCNRLQSVLILDSKKKAVNNFMYKYYSKIAYRNIGAGVGSDIVSSIGKAYRLTPIAKNIRRQN